MITANENIYGSTGATVAIDIPLLVRVLSETGEWT